MHRLTSSLVCLALALPAIAQVAPGETEEPAIRRYTTEVIVFRYAQDVGTGSEVFLPDEPEPEPEELLPGEEFEFMEESMPEPVAQPAAEPEPLPDTGLTLLSPEDYQLDGIMDRLERLDVYDPVMHFGWTQAVWSRDQTAATPLHLFGHPPPELDGSLTLYLGRYLHLLVDLQLDAGAVEPDGPHVYYRLQENRILKNGDLRYYDHPKFGVLAMVTRVEEDEEDPGDGELLGYGSE